MYFRPFSNDKSRSHLTRLKAVISLEDAQEIFKQFHDSAIGGHVGYNNTEDQNCNRYRWKGMTTHLKYFVSISLFCIGFWMS